MSRFDEIVSKAFRLVLLLAAGFGCLSCATTQPYPKSWSALVSAKAGECGDISGTFSNACSPDSPYAHDCVEAGGLAGLLLGKYAGSFHPRLEQVDRVAIYQPTASSLLVVAWKGDELVRKEEIVISPQDCTEEGILVRSGGTGTQIEGGIGYGSSHVVLAKTEDGDLVARTHVRFTGVAFLVPVSGSSQSWKRFEVLSAAGEEP